MPGGDYYTRPEAELCQVQSETCTKIPSSRLFCKTEGRGVLVCENDLRLWRTRVTSSQAETYRLANKCPLCADWTPQQASPSPIIPQTPRPVLQGPLAATLDKAMHAEGLLQDIRQRVLQRLASDAPWLSSSFIEPGFIEILETDQARKERRAI